MARQKMTSKKRMTPAQKYERLGRRYSDFTAGAISIHNAWLGFMVEQEAKGNSKATLDYYRRFYKKLKAFTDKLEAEGGETPVELLEMDGIQNAFVISLGEVNQQTINSYLRGYRAFGNWCEEQGYIKYFKCPIKEVEPPAKQVYTDREIEKLLIRPDIRNYSEFRNFVIINLLLAS